MPTQRPFFANFFSSFRARTTTNPSFQAKSSTTTGAISPSALASSAHASATTTSVTSSSTSAPRNIASKAGAEQNAQPQPTAVASPHTRTTPASPFSTAAFTPGSPSSHFYGPHLPRPSGPPSPGPHSTNLAMSPPGQSTPISRGRQRRGSDSSNSSGAFTDSGGTEKWYIGGRTAAGDERFYTLGLVTGGGGKRVRSLDRLSL